MTKKKVSCLLWIMVALWCVMIFSFSAEDATNSSQLSGGVVETIYDTLSPVMDSVASQDKTTFIDSFETLIRKSAHFLEYCALGTMVFWAGFLLIPKKRWGFVGVGFACLYATSDELHQSFVPGRSCEFRDVCIDTSGATLGVLISLLVIFTITKRRAKADNKKSPLN